MESDTHRRWTPRPGHPWYPLQPQLAPEQQPADQQQHSQFEAPQPTTHGNQQQLSQFKAPSPAQQTAQQQYGQFEAPSSSSSVAVIHQASRNFPTKVARDIHAIATTAGSFVYQSIQSAFSCLPFAVVIERKAVVLDYRIAAGGGMSLAGIQTPPDK